MALTVSAVSGPVLAQDAVQAEPGQDVNVLLLPKFLGITVFDQANQGAEEAAAELQNPTPLTFTGPTAENSVAGQIETVTNAPTQGFDVVLLSNNAGDQIAPVAAAAQEAGTKVVTWDSPIPSAEGECVFVAQVDFDETGQVMADMALSIMGEDGGQVAVLSASPDAANQNAWNAAVRGGPGQRREVRQHRATSRPSTATTSPRTATAQALGLVDKYPDLEGHHGADHGRHRCGRQGGPGRGPLRVRSRSPASVSRARWSTSR